MTPLISIRRSAFARAVSPPAGLPASPQHPLRQLLQRDLKSRRSASPARSGGEFIHTE